MPLKILIPTNGAGILGAGLRWAGVAVALPAWEGSHNRLAGTAYLAYLYSSALARAASVLFAPPAMSTIPLDNNVAV